MAFRPSTGTTDEMCFRPQRLVQTCVSSATVDENQLPRRLEPHAERSTFMRKTNCLHLLLTVAALAALPLIAVSARADKGDIYETNMGMVLRILPSGGTTPITFAQGLPNPKGLVFDGSGRLYVADASAGSITLFTLPDGTAGTYTTGLSSPVGVALDVLGNLYVGESGSGNISKFARDGTKTSFASGLGAPSGLAFDNSGNLFVADFAGGVIYQITPVGTKTTFATGLGAPAGLAFDSAGNLFEADSSTGSIFKFAPNGTKTTFATGLSRPYGLAFEASGDLIVSDNGNGSTFRFTPAAVRTTVFNSNFNTPQFVAIEPATHQLLNISTRGFVEGGNHILIAGFIIGGSRNCRSVGGSTARDTQLERHSRRLQRQLARRPARATRRGYPCAS